MRHALLLELRLDLQQQLVDHALDDRHVERRELDDGVDAVAELGREQPLDGLDAVGGVVRLHEADGRAVHLERAGIGGHDDDHVAEIRLAAVVVGERAVVHDLQQQVEHVRVRLLDFVEQQHAMRMLGDRLGQQTALVETHVPRRRADQARHRVALHVLGHVEADEFDAHGDGKLARDLGLADARRTGEQETADRLSLIAQARARHLDGRGQRFDGLVLAEDHQLQIALQIAQHFLVRRATRSWPECAPCARPRPRCASP